MSSEITSMMHQHYSATFQAHGCTSAGVDWGSDAARATLRHQKMSALFTTERFSVLDVGCGFGAFLDYLKLQPHLAVEYTGIDVVAPMIEAGRNRHPDVRFRAADFMECPVEEEAYDYVVCNGILTQKLEASLQAMDQFTKTLLTRMFRFCSRGIAFNMMTSKVNFMAPNLFYKSPLETLGWTLETLSPHVRMDHAYPLYEYTTYVYKPGRF